MKLTGILASLQSQWLKFFTGLSQTLVIVALLGLIGLVSFKALHYFWPKPVATVQFQQTTGSLASVYAYTTNDQRHNNLYDRIWLHMDTWSHRRNQTEQIIARQQISQISYDKGVARIDFRDGRYLFARLASLSVSGEIAPLQQLPQVRGQAAQLRARMQQLNVGELRSVNVNIAQLRNQNVAETSAAMQKLLIRFHELRGEVTTIERQLAQFRLNVIYADGEQESLPIAKVKEISLPNDIGLLRQVQVMLGNIAAFLTEESRDANQAGGVFPAIFGTVLMVLLMTVIVSPLGIVAAIYLTEYAPNNAIVSLIRISVSNLAAVPSVVYGVFGLGFFVYQLGGNIDALFYPERLPTATFGKPGLAWASLTMALLTLPVVIVATEEGLRRVPGGLRDASYALGATRYETIRRIVLPVASSSLMTGVILAIARGAGEVAPMLMVGAVKYAPVLPIDSEFPWLHLERQFMHLGVLIYDGAFHGQSTQQGSGIMFASCFLLLLVVILLNSIAVSVRNRLQDKYGY